jgi:hypothetical protein
MASPAGRGSWVWGLVRVHSSAEWVCCGRAEASWMLVVVGEAVSEDRVPLGRTSGSAWELAWFGLGVWVRALGMVHERWMPCRSHGMMGVPHGMGVWSGGSCRLGEADVPGDSRMWGIFGISGFLSIGFLSLDGVVLRAVRPVASSVGLAEVLVVGVAGVRGWRSAEGAFPARGRRGALRWGVAGTRLAVPGPHRLEADGLAVHSFRGSGDARRRFPGAMAALAGGVAGALVSGGWRSGLAEGMSVPPGRAWRPRVWSGS